MEKNILKLTIDILFDLAQRKKYFSKEDFKQALEEGGFEVKDMDLVMEFFKKDLVKKNGLYKLDITHAFNEFISRQNKQ